MRTLSGHSSWIWSLAILPNHTLVSGFDDNTITFWNTTTGMEFKMLTGHNNAVMALAFLPDEILVSGSGDSTIKIWCNISIYA